MKNAQYILKNSVLTDSKDAALSVLNKAMFFGFAVYESVKVVQGRTFAAGYHVERLLNSANIIGLKHSFTAEGVANDINALVKVNGLTDALIRILLVGGDGAAQEPQLFIFSVGLTFYPDKFYRDGVSVITYTGERFLPRAKTNNLLLNFLAYQKAQEADALDVLLIDRNGNVTEGTRTNIFVLSGKTLITPPKEDVLEGITRKILIEAAQGICEVREEKIPLNSLAERDALFLDQHKHGCHAGEDNRRQ